jgi:putative phage-type endonuclease
MNKTITIDDIDTLLLNYDDEIYTAIRMGQEIDATKYLEMVKDEYKLIDRSISLSNSQTYFLENYIREYLKIKTQLYQQRFHRIASEIPSILEKLKTLELPEQRSPEWYEMRNHILTASSLADALGKGHFKTQLDLMIAKTSTEEAPFISNNIIEWGVKYEPIATSFYEKMNHLKIVEFGLVPHPKLTIFGASPDGICDLDSPTDYVGRMLEIKCPPIRKFTKEVPYHYWIQMQGQLETCDLEECDFLQVKLFEYDSDDRYNEDISYNEDETVKKGYTSNHLPKGSLVTITSLDEKGATKYMYEYGEFYLSYEEHLTWFQTIQAKYQDEKYTVEQIWWRIDRYECTLVGRDRQWWNSIVPDILDFWENVEHYRMVGNQELVDKKNKRKRKKKPTVKKNIITINAEIESQIQTKCFLDSDDEP